MRDFVVFRWRPVDREKETSFRLRAGRLVARGYEILLDWRGVLVLARKESLEFPPTILPSNRGVIFGLAFRRGEGAASSRLDVTDIAEDLSWTQSAGETFVRDVWGAYAAFLVDTGHDRLHAIACPTGALALFRAELDGGHVLFANPQAYADAFGPLEIAPEQVAAFLRYPNRIDLATGLVGVKRVWPGSRITLDRGAAEESIIWRPPQPDATRTNLQDNVRDLRAALDGVAGALATARPHVLHRLSGGLDSSAILATLKRAAPDARLTAVHDYGLGPGEGDERHFARLVAAHLDVPLIENEIDPGDVDYARMLDMPLAAAPAPTLLTWANARPSVSAAGQNDALITSGQGGDHVFYRGRGHLGAADAWRDTGMLVSFWREAMAAARRSRVSVWSLLPRAIIEGALGRPYDLNRHFRREGQSMATARETAREHAALPWFEQLASMRPGGAHRIALLMDAQTYFGPSQLAARYTLAPPVLFEPAIEALMRIPSYAMNAGGDERGLVRQAFASDLPRELVYRRTKGQTTRFVARIIRRNRDFLIDALTGGELKQAGLVDLAPILDMIKASHRPDSAPPSALTPILCAEFWLRSVKRAREAQCEPRTFAAPSIHT